MRRVLIIGLLPLLMYALQFLQVEVEAPFNPKSLATLGFVLLAAYTFDEITNTFRLPKITGYIITGIMFGPHVINLFSTGVVSDLKLINELAIGLIALTAGGEMKLNELKIVAKTLSLIVLIKGLLILTVITLTVFAARPLIPFLAAEETLLVLSVGMIFGVLAIGTSPAATIAVINETESRGRLSNITLGDLRSSLSTLTYLTNIDLLTKEIAEDSEYRFAINRLIYKPLARELRARNILH